MTEAELVSAAAVQLEATPAEQARLAEAWRARHQPHDDAGDEPAEGSTT
jgi:hypothetical protein